VVEGEGCGIKVVFHSSNIKMMPGPKNRGGGGRTKSTSGV